MNRIRSLAVIGLVGSAALTGCNQGDPKAKQDIEQLKKDVKELQDERQMLRDYLGPGGPLNVWLKYLAEAVCEIEKVTGGLPPNKRICPPQPPHDIKPPPTYPK
jgi:hypothetical protein